MKVISALILIAFVGTATAGQPPPIRPDMGTLGPGSPHATVVRPATPSKSTGGSGGGGNPHTIVIKR